MPEPELPPRVQDADRRREFLELVDKSSLGPLPKTMSPLGSSNNKGEWCAIHNEYEEDRPGDYKVCGECCHVWRTEEEFVADVLAARRDHAEASLRFYGIALAESSLDPRDEPICPLCTHDF